MCFTLVLPLCDVCILGFQLCYLRYLYTSLPFYLHPSPNVFGQNFTCFGAFTRCCGCGLPLGRIYLSVDTRPLLIYIHNLDSRPYLGRYMTIWVDTQPIMDPPFFCFGGLDLWRAAASARPRRSAPKPLAAAPCFPAQTCFPFLQNL